MSGRYHHKPRPMISALALEDELREQDREAKRIFAENRVMIEENTFLHRELSAAKLEITRLDEVIPTLRAERETRQRDLIKRKTMLEADLRAFEPSKLELARLRAEVLNLNSAREELSMQIQGLTNIVNRFRDENQKVGTMRINIEKLKNGLAEARKDCEYEKKATEEQAEMKQAVEKNLEFMAREIEELRAEKVNSDRKLLCDPGMDRHYERFNGSSEIRYPSGNGYAYDWRHYEKRSPTRREHMY